MNQWALCRFHDIQHPAPSGGLCAVNSEESACVIDRSNEVVGTWKGLGQGRLRSSATPGTRHKHQLAASPFYAQALCQKLPSAQGWKQFPRVTAHAAACTGVRQPFQWHLRLSRAHCCQGPTLRQVQSLEGSCKRLECS